MQTLLMLSANNNKTEHPNADTGRIGLNDESKLNPGRKPKSRHCAIGLNDERKRKPNASTVRSALRMNPNRSTLRL